MYIDQIIQTNPSFVVNSLNIHRLLITSVMLACKFFDDHYYHNAYYAKVGGVPLEEMNSLEVEFLFMTNFSLYVETEKYCQYYNELYNHTLNDQCSCHEHAGKVPPLVLPNFPKRYVSSDSEEEEDEDDDWEDVPHAGHATMSLTADPYAMSDTPSQTPRVSFDTTDTAAMTAQSYHTMEAVLEINSKSPADGVGEHQRRDPPQSKLSQLLQQRDHQHDPQAYMSSQPYAIPCIANSYSSAVYSEQIISCGSDYGDGSLSNLDGQPKSFRNSNELIYNNVIRCGGQQS